ncbi:hypothetical protein ES288_D03G181300v1, partial [Gossypium darwinii]
LCPVFSLPNVSELQQSLRYVFPFPLFQSQLNKPLFCEQDPFLIQSSSHAPIDFVSSILPIRRNKTPYTAHWFLFRRPKTLQKYVETVFFP